MYTLDDILDDSSKFQNGMFISFPQFVYCSSPIICWLALRARRARASQMTMYGFSWRGSHSPWHRCVRCIMTSLATTVMSHENAPNIEFSYVSFGVWNDGNSRNQTLTKVDYFNHVGQIIHNKKYLNIRNIFLSHLQSFFSEWSFGILARESGLLHVQSVINKRWAYKYEVIVILTISMITSKHAV